MIKKILMRNLQKDNKVKQMKLNKVKLSNKKGK